MIHARFATDGRINVRLERRRTQHRRHPAHPRRRNKTRQVRHHPTPNRDDRTVTSHPRRREPIVEQLRPTQRLARVSRRNNRHLHSTPARPQCLRRTIAEQVSHVLIRNHQRTLKPPDRTAVVAQSTQRAIADDHTSCRMLPLQVHLSIHGSTISQPQLSRVPPMARPDTFAPNLLCARPVGFAITESTLKRAFDPVIPQKKFDFREISILGSTATPC